MMKLNFGNRLQGIRIQYTGARARSPVEVVSIKCFAFRKNMRSGMGKKGAFPHFSRAFILSIYSRRIITNIPVKRLRRPVIIIICFIREFEGCLVIEGGANFPTATFPIWRFLICKDRAASFSIKSDGLKLTSDICLFFIISVIWFKKNRFAFFASIRCSSFKSSSAFILAFSSLISGRLLT